MSIVVKWAPGVEIVLFSSILLVIMSAMGAMYLFIFLRAVAYHKLSISCFLSFWYLGTAD